MQSKTCPKCGITKPAVAEYFCKDKHRKDGLCCHCKRCRKEYRRTDKGKKVFREWSRKQRLEYPEKCKARSVVSNAIRYGKLLKQPCPCGELEVEAHHKDYSKPLDVQWLCDKHHMELHRKERQCVSL